MKSRRKIDLDFPLPDQSQPIVYGCNQLKVPPPPEGFGITVEEFVLGNGDRMHSAVAATFCIKTEIPKFRPTWIYHNVALLFDRAVVVIP